MSGAAAAVAGSGTVLVCGCSGASKRARAVCAASSCPEVALRVVEDLCGMAALEPERLREWARQGELTVLACHPRTIRSLFSRVGAGWDEQRMRAHNLRDSDTDLDPAAFGVEFGTADGGPQPTEQNPGAWVPWYPVIDPDRCTNCGQCLNFCLFGVYSLNAGKQVEVTHPSGCKTNCPACARICPAVAIIFPKYGQAPIDGDEVGDLEAEQQRIQLDLERIVGTDLQTALAERKLRRQRMALLRRDTAQAPEQR